MEKEEEISIKIKTLDNQISINIRKYATLLELKEKINQLLNAPIANQRLIYQGKMLQNNAEKLKHYKISNDSVLHLTMRKVTLSDDTNQNNNNNNNINNLNHIQNEENNSEHSAGTNNTGLGFIRLNHNTTRRLQRKNMHFDPSDCIETLYQNILVINHLLKLRNNFTISNFLQNKTIIPFNLSKKKFEIGEWVDVKDTTDNWLEGQIINKRTSNNNKIQFLIHYSGWGGRWDEWIDQSSPRLSYFRTYTLQSIQSVLLSPNPTLVSDGNLMNNDYNQKRPVDLFFYFNKISSIINEINKIIEKMNNFKKRDNINIEDKDDIKEHKEKDKEKESYLNMNNFIPFSFNELEIIQITSQMIPILDRCGRLMSDLSLLLSHTIFNPNLYPHLLLGHNNNEISDSMSCTSGYSMLTNESNSILSGFTGNFIFRQDRDILNNLRPITRNNNISRTNIRDININQNNNNNININTNTTKSTTINKNNSNNNLNNININSNNLNNNNSNQFSRPHYIINSSNLELPFIQRLNFNNNMHQNYINNINLNNNTQNPFDTFPKINLQIPPLLSPNQNSLISQGGFNALEEQNNIYLLNNHIFVDNSINNINNMNNINVLNNNSVDRNQVQNDNISEDNYEQQYLNSNLNNTFNNNSKYLHLPRRRNSGNSCKTNKSADQMYTYQYKQFKFDKEQNDLMKNLNKDQGYYDSLSMKSDKMISMKNKNLSYKSVSEIDEFGEYDHKNDIDEEDNKKKDNNTYTTSRKSVESGYFKEFLEEDNSTGINNINYNNINNNTINNYNINSNNINTNNINTNNNNTNNINANNINNININISPNINLQNNNIK